MNKNALKQSFFIPKPTLTEESLPDQSGRVFIVTGGYSGIGYELVKILYRSNGRVYIAGRNEKKAQEAIANIKKSYPEGRGTLEFLHLDLSDLSTIRKSADDFLLKEQRLDVLTNNAGVGSPAAGSTDAQGHELHLGTNCLGPFLFTELLTPILRKTAAVSPPGSVRVTWAGSLTTEVSAPNGGVVLAEDGVPVVSKTNQMSNYGQSKAGNIFLASEYARRHQENGIVSVAWNPGNLRTNLMRNASWLERTITNLVLHPAIYGAYTVLYAGWSTDVTLTKSGSYIVPWGQFGPVRDDIQDALQSENGNVQRFWQWCEKETRIYI